MSSLITSLKSEIARVAKKELKSELLSMRKALTTHRSEIAALKRLVKTLASEIKQVKRSSKSAGTVQKTSIKRPRPFKFNAGRFAELRNKWGITQAQMAQLLGASSLSVHKWEKGMSNPRAAQLDRIAPIMKLGKREVLQRLQVN
ncbi:MAG: helix-turn-helix transcriptional regulator [Rhodoferax sp.]|nr:helix-turn-helix transcriptional regulator [Rhodoferax sp.]